MKGGLMMEGPTTDHAEIQLWAARHNAVPAEVKQHVFDSKPTIMHFLFGEARGGTPELRPLSWEEFFARFDFLRLAIVYDETPVFEIVQLESRLPGMPPGPRA